MGIKKLIDNNITSDFVLKKSEGILVIHLNHDYIFLLLENPTATDLDKLEKFSSMISYKYLGSKDIYDEIILKKFNWPEPERLIFIEENRKLLFDSTTGKIKFEKKATFQKNDKTFHENEKRNVLIIDDSKTIQKILSSLVNESEKLNLIGVAGSPSEAKDIIESSRRIDLITLDIHMPEMNGVDFLKSYLVFKNIPTVMISSVSMNEGPLVMEALSSGASTYIQKPSINKLNDIKGDIIEKLEIIADTSVKDYEFKSIKPRPNSFQHTDGLIAIGSSTGGTQALQEIFTSLPDEIPPIVVVQHIPAVFSKALAERLNSLTSFTVKEADADEFVKKNTIYIAPGGKQMKIVKRGEYMKIVITDDEPVNRFKPSVDYMFNSLSTIEEENLIAIILTGMGKDGAKGLLSLQENGALTIAQDERTSIVFGMPKEAISLGAAKEVLPLQSIPNKVVEFFNLFERKKVA